MYIEPNSTIYILRGVPLDETYEHTIYFSAQQGHSIEEAQLAYFMTKVKYTCQSYTYQRVKRGYIRVHYPAEKLYDCNYLCFQNTGYAYTDSNNITHPAKWFFAFIKSVEYINNEVSEIQFSIDVMQTWFWHCTLKPSFVIREHSATDQIGDNILEEGLETGDLIFERNAQAPYYNKSNLEIIVAASFMYDGSDFVDAEGGLYGGIYTGLHYNEFLGENMVDDANAFLLEATTRNKETGIVSVFMFPYAFRRNAGSDGPGNPPVYNMERITKNTSWTYTYNGRSGPRNKKLYCYPYNYLMVKASDGNSAEYRWEFFDEDTGFEGKAQFWHCASMSATGQIAMVPYKYNHDGYNSNYLNFREACILSSLPQCAFTIDAYRAWIAQQGGEVMYAQQKLMIPLQHTLINFGTGAATVATAIPSGVGPGQEGGSIGGFSGSLHSVVDAQALLYDYIKEKKVHQNLPPQTHGINTNVLDLTMNTFGFLSYNAKVRPQYAAIIDSYFDKYGYATNMLKVPNIHVRENWTYTKTSRCVLDGINAPADDVDKICSIFDAGITFWDRGEAVGDYLTRTNRCLSEIQSS